jgi:hypothetical protein
LNIHPSQTKILEGGTKDEILIFEAFFKGVSTRFGLRIVENSIVENPDFIFCSSFQNLRLGNIKFGFHLLFIRPKSSFGEAWNCWFGPSNPESASPVKCILNLCSPHDDWGRMNKMGNPDFEGSTFQGREYSIWATNH